MISSQWLGRGSLATVRFIRHFVRGMVTEPMVSADFQPLRSHGRSYGNAPTVFLVLVVVAVVVMAVVVVSVVFCDCGFGVDGGGETACDWFGIVVVVAAVEVVLAGVLVSVIVIAVVNVILGCVAMTVIACDCDCGCDCSCDCDCGCVAM